MSSGISEKTGEIYLDDKVVPTYVLASAGEIALREAEMGEKLARHYMNRKGHVHVLTVMNGAVHFASGLRRAMQRTAPELKLTSDHVTTESYIRTKTASGVTRQVHDLNQPVDGRDVLIVDNVINSGLTLQWLTNKLTAGTPNPSSLAVAALVRKTEASRVDLGDLDLDMVSIGFDDIPNSRFLVGYGLDYKQEGRDLEDIHAIDRDAMDSYPSRFAE